MNITRKQIIIVALFMIAISITSIFIKERSSYEGCEGLSGKQLEACNEVKKNKAKWTEWDNKKKALELELGGEIEILKAEYETKKAKLEEKYEKKINPIIQKRDKYSEANDEWREVAFY